MLEKINGQVRERLVAEYAFKQVGQHLREGRCPSCEKKTLWTWLDKPGSIQCDRVGKCGWQATAKELYPDLFEKLNQNYAATPEDPNKTANAYMELVRGFDIGRIKQWWQQGKYWNPNADKGTATVRFNLTEDGKVYWERFVEDVTVTDPDTGEKSVRKSRASGSFRGLWWQPPNQAIEIEDKVYIVEAIIDAISLIANGYKAVSIMSSGTFPSEAIKPHLGKKVTWILALDNDIAGRKATKKHALKLAELGQEVLCALSSESQDKSDWNDLHIRHKLNPEYMQDYLYYGALELAKSAIDKALVMWRRNPLRKYFVFSFGNQTYSFKLDEDEYAKSYDRALEHFGNPATLDDRRELAFKTPGNENEDKAQKQAFRQIAAIIEIANFRLEYLYSQLPASGDDGWYFLKVNFANGQKPFQCAVSGDAFGEAKRFKKIMQTKAHGALFTGVNRDMDYIYKNWFSEAQKTVRILDFVGYDEETKAYVFPEYAVENGKVLKLNSEQYFTLKDTGIKTHTDIKQRLTDSQPADFLQDYIQAFGMNGLIGLSWWLGCLVCEQIRKKHSSYPYLQVIGEPDSGKSAMVHFLWKLFGKNGDSFNPNASSIAGRFRKMAEVSNLPIVFNEVDNENENGGKHVKKFLWDEHKDLFEGELGRVTGNKSQDNSTRKPVFKAALVAVQNVRVVASTAMQSRFIHINFDRSHHSLAGKRAADRLRDMDITAVSGFLLKACAQADKLLGVYAEAFPHYQKELGQSPTLKMQRIIQNHAQLMALAECLKLFLPISDATVIDLQQAIKHRAEQWQSAMEEDHPVVQQFWFAFEYLNSRASQTGNSTETDLVNHSHNPLTEIAINLEDFNAKCIEAKLETMPSRELRQYLPGSRKHKFLKLTSVKSRIQKRTLRCMIFKA